LIRNSQKLEESSTLKVKLIKGESFLSFNYCFHEMKDEPFENCILLNNLDKSKWQLDDLKGIFIFCVEVSNFKESYKKYSNFLSSFENGAARSIFVVNKVIFF
jgi:hypothetical protein